MSDAPQYDIAFLGSTPRTTIVTKDGSRVVNGGAYFTAPQQRPRWASERAALTRLALRIFRVFVCCWSAECWSRRSPHRNRPAFSCSIPRPPRRAHSLGHSVAEPFEPADVESISAPVWSIGASIRGEVSLTVLKAIKAKGARVGLDAQGFVRVVRDGQLAYDTEWPEKAEVLRHVDVFKADVVEAEILTGTRDLHEAARILARYGVPEFVLTHGDGVVVYAEGSFVEAPFRPRSLVGRSGRGDTCLASYLAARISMDPEKATFWSAALTSLKMEALGPFSGTREDVESALRERYGR